MSENCCLKLLEEKVATQQIQFLAWSPKADILAIGNGGEVELRRLTWQKIWRLQAPTDQSTVTSICWKPDGKYLAVGYSTGSVFLVDVEDNRKIRQFHVGGAVTSLSWLEKSEIQFARPYKDESPQFFCKLPSLPRKNEQIEGQCTDSASTPFNVLAVGTSAGQVKLYANGILEIFNSDLGNFYSIESLHATEDLGLFSICLRNGAETSLAFVDTTLIARYSIELQTLAQRYLKLQDLMDYSADCLKSLEESWEDSLAEFDKKIDNLAKSLPSHTSLACDLLELLLFGTCSIYTQSFLIHQLTDKGLARLKQAIESSYSNMETIATVNLFSVGQQLAFHCCQLLSMAKRKEIFGPLGFDYEPNLKAIQSIGQFMTKSSEMLEVISMVLKQLEAFFHWLHVSIFCLSEEPLPSDVEPLTMTGIEAVASFIEENFSTKAEELSADSMMLEVSEIKQEAGSKNQRLEKVGQYLRDENLMVKLDLEENPIENLLKENSDLQEIPGFFIHNRDSSLAQEQRNLKQSLEQVFAGISERLSEISLFSSQLLSKNSDMIAQISLSNNQGIAIATSSKSSPGFAYYEVNKSESMLKVNSAYFHFENLMLEGRGLVQLEVVGVEFYTKEILSLLLRDAGQEATIYAQIPSRSLHNHLVLSKTATFSQENVNLLEVINETEVKLENRGNLSVSLAYRAIDKFLPGKFAVSGSRKVSAFLNSTMKVVKLFEMEVEEGEELNDSSMREDVDMNNSDI